MFLKAGSCYLELFRATATSPAPAATGPGPDTPAGGISRSRSTTSTPSWPRSAPTAKVTAGPMDFDAFIPGWRSAWVADPDGNIVEISQGFVDEEHPPEA